MAPSEDVEMAHHSDEDSPLSDLPSESGQGSPSTIASSIRSTRRHKVINYSELNSGKGGGYDDHDDDQDEMDQDDEDDEDEMSEEEEAPRPARKKAKSSKAKKPAKKKSNSGSNKKGPLRGYAKLQFQQDFQNAPLDVIRDIATHLDLKTLLAFTRTCRVTRALVLDPGSASIWAAVKEREGVPQLSGNVLKDVELARLIFDRTCHLCGKGKAVKVDYTFMKRLCSKCWRSNVKYGSHHTNYHPSTLECIPVSDGGDYHYYSIHWTPDAVKMSAQLKALDLGTEEGKEFVKKQTDLAKAVATDGRKLENWRNRVSQEKDYAVHLIAANRKRDLTARLESLGYDKKYLYRTELTSNHHFKAKTELTDAAFAKMSPELTGILDELVARDEATKAADQESSQAKKLKDDYNKLKLKLKDQLGLFPPFGDYLDLPSVKPLWEVDPKAKKSKGKRTEDNTQDQIEDEVTALANSIRDTVYLSLVEAHAEAEALPGGASVAGFDLADAKEDEDKVLMGRVTSAFACPREGCPVWDTFPAILEHACGEHLLRGTFEDVGDYKFADAPLETSPEKVAAIRMILAAAGEREKTAAVDTLDELSWRLVCKECPKAHEFSINGPPKPKPRPVTPPAVPPPVVGPMDKFVIKTEAGSSFVKPKSQVPKLAVDSEDEDGEPPLHYDWKEIASRFPLAIYHAVHGHSHGYTLEAKFVQLDLEVRDAPGLKPVARPSRFLTQAEAKSRRPGRLGAATYGGRYGYDYDDEYFEDDLGPHGDGCMCDCPYGEDDSELDHSDDGFDGDLERAMHDAPGPKNDGEDEDGEEAASLNEGRAKVKAEDEEMELGDDNDDEDAEEVMRAVTRVFDSEEDEE